MHSVNGLKGFELAAPDGDIGTVREVYFDDQQWVIRHLVVETGGWLSSRQVLISPHAVRAIDIDARRLTVELTRQQVQDAPSIATDRPVSRQYEMASADYYGYPYYWGGTGLWGVMDAPLMGPIAPLMPPGFAGEDAIEGSSELRERTAAERQAADPHLRSSNEVTGYDIMASDGDIGHIDDFLFDAHSWRIELVVVDTNNWLPDRLVLVPPRWIASVDWGARQAVVTTTRAAVEASPPFVRRSHLDADEAARIRRHFEGSV